MSITYETALFDAAFCPSLGVDGLPLPSSVLSWLSLILGCLDCLLGVPVGFRLHMNSWVSVPAFWLLLDCSLLRARKFRLSDLTLLPNPLVEPRLGLLFLSLSPVPSSSFVRDWGFSFVSLVGVSLPSLVCGMDVAVSLLSITAVPGSFLDSLFSVFRSSIWSALIMFLPGQKSGFELTVSLTDRHVPQKGSRIAAANTRSSSNRACLN